MLSAFKPFDFHRGLKIWFGLLPLLLCLSAFISCDEGCKNRAARNYDPSADIHDPCMCNFDGLEESCATENPVNLIIRPIQQQTEVWCWLAVGEMIFKYYDLPSVNPFDYQCGIIAAVGYSGSGPCDKCNINCGNCIRPAGSPPVLSSMLSEYPKVACRNLFEQNRTLKNTYVSNFLAASFLTSELDAGRPVIAGINPSQFPLPGNSQHVAVIKGYYFDNLGNLILLVNDPYPYWLTGFDPYVFHGAINNFDLSYQIPYINFVNGLLWNTSWYGIGF